MSTSLRTILKVAALTAALCCFQALAALAQEPVTIQISVQNHQFHSREIRGPANVPIILRIKNEDNAAMEFESVSLRVEKIVAAKSEGIVRLRALAPGRYEFFDDFHQETRGILVIQ